MLAMACPKCYGRWIALHKGATIGSTEVSYHFDRNALRCPDCNAQPGETCANARTGEPLERAPAHAGRIRAAATAKETP